MTLLVKLLSSIRSKIKTSLHLNANRDAYIPFKDMYFSFPWLAINKPIALDNFPHIEKEYCLNIRLFQERKKLDIVWVNIYCWSLEDSEDCTVHIVQIMDAIHVALKCENMFHCSSCMQGTHESKCKAHVKYCSASDDLSENLPNEDDINFPKRIQLFNRLLLCTITARVF